MVYPSRRQVALVAMVLGLLPAGTRAGIRRSQGRPTRATEEVSAQGKRTPSPPSSSRRESPETTKKADRTPEPDQRPPLRPSFLLRKPQVPKVLLEKKKEGWYIVPMPIIYYDDDRGLGMGAFGEIYDNGRRASPFFRFVPYDKKIYFSGEWATRDFWAFRGRYEHLYVGGSRFRFQGEADVERYGRANYFGVGEDAMRKLTNPRVFQQFDSYADYHNAITLIENGETLSRYNDYGETRVRVLGTVKADVLGGLVRLLAGFQLAYYWVEDRTGTLQEGHDLLGNRMMARHGTTKLAADCATGRVKGCDGGFDNLLKVGIVFDTRDFEPDPETGLVLQLVAELSPRFLGSAEDYLRINTMVEGFYSLIPELTRLVVALRFLLQVSFGDVPFFAQDSYAFADKDRFGIGGFDTMRGYQLNRFIGRATGLFAFELRWRFLDWRMFGMQWSLGITPFLELGRVFDSPSEFSFRDWRYSAGGGIRLGINLSTIISFDFGVSRENQTFFMSMGHQF